MPDYNFKNNLKSTLQSKLWNDATSIYCNHVVNSTDANARRNAWPAFPFTLTVVDTANSHIEIIKCTSLANNSSDAIVFHCDRAQENTTAQTFEIATTSVEHRLTSEALNSITNAVSPATTTSRGIARVATSDDLVDGATINNGPALLAAGVHTSVAAAAGKVPVADSNGKLDAWVSQQKITHYATSSTASGTAAKTAACSGFTLAQGARVMLTFANKNTVAGALTLDVNSTGAKTICDESGQAVSATNKAYFPNGCEIEFVYDGANWRYLRRVVKAYSSGVSWYRVQSDGYIEQGGQVGNPGNTTATVTLNINQIETNYDASIEFLTNQTVHYTQIGFASTNNKTVSSFQFTGNSDTDTSYNPTVQWRARGY